MEKLNKKSEKYGFQVKSAQNGIYMMPMLDGKTIEQEDFEKLESLGNIQKIVKDDTFVDYTQAITDKEFWYYFYGSSYNCAYG